VSGSEDEILRDEDPSKLEAHVRFQSPPSLFDLKKLLSIVTEESADYTLWPVCNGLVNNLRTSSILIMRCTLFQQNCYFFASVIQENLSALHGGYLVSGKLNHKGLAKEVRERIRARVEQF
jgi:hypothetical protein